LAFFCGPVVVGFGDSVEQLMRAQQLKTATNAAGRAAACVGVGLLSWKACCKRAG